MSTMTGFAARPDGWHPAVDAYMAHQRAAGVAGKSITLWRYHLRRFSQEIDCGPWDITYPMIIEWLGSHGWAGATIRSHRTTLRGFYGWAHAAGYMDHDPARLVPKVKYRQRKRAMAADPVIDAAMAATDAAGDWRVRLALELGSRMGMRREEIAKLASTDVFMGDDETPWLLVHGKGAKERELPLTDDAYRMICARPAGQIFPGKHRPEDWPADKPGILSPYYIARLVKKSMSGEFTSHQLRHRFCTTAYEESGHDILTVSELMGHSSVAVTQTYLHTDRRRARAVLESASTGPARRHLAAVI